MGDIHHLLSRALEDRGHSFEICWTPPGFLHEYVLSVEASPRGGDAQWKMFAGLSQSAKPLWTYISCDVLLVYNLVMSTAGDVNKNLLVKPTDEPLQSNSNIATLVRRDVTSSQTNPVLDMPGNGRKSQALAGDLSLVQVPTLLQSILMAKMTGVLNVEDPDGKGRSQVFFVDGVPVHCVAAESFGEEGIFELLTWKDGSFHFDAKVTNDVRTIKHGLESLLLQGMTLIDNAAYLRNLGLRPESYLIKNLTELSEAEFEAHCKKGAPVNMQKQKLLYKSITPDETVQQILDKFKWPRSQWVPVMCNLFKTELVSLAPPPQEEPPPIPTLEPKRIDKRLIQNVMMSLRSPETGMFTYPAFLYFLEQEYFRAYRSANPISIVVFQMRVQAADPNAPREPLPTSALSSAVRRISRVKRHVDLLAHYETYDYALLLPNTKTAGAQIFASRVVKALMSEPLVPGSINPENLKIAFGIASIPEDFLELSHVLAGAEVAKNAAMVGPEPVVLYRDIKQDYKIEGAATPQQPTT